MSVSDLKNLTVMVTRPSPKGEALCELIQMAGGYPIFFPTIHFVSLTHSPDFIKGIDRLDVFDHLIFISPQAVQQTAALLHARWPCFPAQVQVIAMGRGTALALREAHLPVHIYPEECWDSEGVLALSDLQNVRNKRIALVHGQGGRELLAAELTRRGAELTHIIAYQRCLPSVDVFPYLSLLKEEKIDIIITTSAEILQNLIVLLGQAAGAELYHVPLVVVSERMAVLAKQIGFQTILFAKNAGHEAVMAILKEHICQMKLKKR